MQEDGHGGGHFPKGLYLMFVDSQRKRIISLSMKNSSYTIFREFKFY